MTLVLLVESVLCLRWFCVVSGVLWCYCPCSLLFIFVFLCFSSCRSCFFFPHVFFPVLDVLFILVCCVLFSLLFPILFCYALVRLVIAIVLHFSPHTHIHLYHVHNLILFSLYLYLLLLPILPPPSPPPFHTIIFFSSLRHLNRAGKVGIFGVKVPPTPRRATRLPNSRLT